MSDNCPTIVIGQAGGKFLHRCPLCRTEYTSKYSDPSLFKAECRIKKRQRDMEDAATPEWGPGTELTKLIGEHGLASFGCGACHDLARQMDQWGPAGCRERRAEITLDIRQRANKVDWWTKSKAALALIRQPWFVCADPIGSMVDEACRRAEVIDGNLIEHLVGELRGPARPHNPWWNGRPEIQAAHQVLLDEAAAGIYRLPDGFAGRGIVTLAGGEYFAAGFVLLSVLRQLGCTLPVEWWFLPGEGSANERALAAALGGVECVELTDRCQPRRIGGWEAKVHAVMHSRFAEVLFLDADQVPTRDPAYLFDDPRFADAGAVFWQDNPPFGYSLSEDAFRIARLPIPAKTWDWQRPSDYDAWETGQMLIDKRRHWGALCVTAHLCDRSEFWFPGEHRGHEAHVRYAYGDKDMPWLAWHRLGHAYAAPPLPVYVGDKTRAGMFLQPDLDGRPLFQHRVHNKPSLTQPLLPLESFQHADLCRAALDQLRWYFGRKAWFAGGETRVLELAIDGQAGEYTWEIRGEYLSLQKDGSEVALLGRDDHGNWCNHGTGDFLMDAPPAGFAIPYERAELAIYNDVTRDNEYRLPEAFEAADAIVDVGGHCGIFARACLSRGAGRVISVEPHPDNFARLEHNLRPFGDRSERIHAAAWSAAGELCLAQPAGAQHTGGWCAVQVADGIRVRAIPFDTLVAGSIRLVKLDCEGSEWEILRACRSFPAIAAWCGEWHQRTFRQADAELRALLEPHGYRVVVEPHPESDRLGHFWATR